MFIWVVHQNNPLDSLRAMNKTDFIGTASKMFASKHLSSSVSTCEHKTTHNSIYASLALMFVHE